MPASKSEFETLSRIRLDEAKALLSVTSYDGAFYLAGYSIECALKAIYCARFSKDELPDKQAVLHAYTHNLADLITHCGLSAELQNLSSKRQRYWAVVSKWKESSRYERRTEQEARNIIDAIEDRSDGI